MAAEAADFPHEIGVFLGYPLEDVVGFIRHRGKCFTCCGCWKSYGCLLYTSCTAIVFCKNAALADPKLFTADAAPL